MHDVILLISVCICKCDQTQWIF